MQLPHAMGTQSSRVNDIDTSAWRSVQSMVTVVEKGRENAVGVSNRNSAGPGSRFP